MSVYVADCGGIGERLEVPDGEAVAAGFGEMISWRGFVLVNPLRVELVVCLFVGALTRKGGALGHRRTGENLEYDH